MDEFAGQLKDSFDKGDSLYSLEYQRAASKLYYIRKRNRRYWTEWGEQERKEALKLQKEGQAKMHSVPSKKASTKIISSWLYHRIRMCIWKQWKKPKTKKRNILKLGVPEDLVHISLCTSTIESAVYRTVRTVV